MHCLLMFAGFSHFGQDKSLNALESDILNIFAGLGGAT